MEIANNIIKGYLQNVYFVTGTAYAGKSTIVNWSTVAFYFGRLLLFLPY